MKRLLWFGATLLTTLSVWGAFDRPSQNERLSALGNLYEESDILRRLLTSSDDFSPIRLPGPNDWLSQHHEDGETFEQYKNSEPNRPDSIRRVLYLLPLGRFPEEASPPLEDIRAYAAAYFQLETRILPAYLPTDEQFVPRQNRHTGQRQVLATSVLEFLKTRLPADAYCLLGVTMEDLYPAPSWNYVFGQASLGERVGVYSFVRYDPAFWDEERGKDYRDVILRRSCKVLAHETGHMFGLQHCIFYDCVLNGSNHLVEADSRPQQLCPLCLRKLHYAGNFDAVKRYEQLREFYRKHGWFEDADWVERQLAKLQSP
ncbi:MAG: hypothetical protein HYV95_06515 [Opitutae bacterium]|nr:hypothetical protein [Opitutae bacterium]